MKFTVLKCFAKYAFTGSVSGIEEYPQQAVTTGERQIYGTKTREDRTETHT